MSQIAYTPIAKCSRNGRKKWRFIHWGKKDNELNSLTEKLRNGELKRKRKEGQESHVWERFGEVVEDDSSTGFVMCDDCEALYKFHSRQDGDFKYGLQHVKGTVDYCSD
jgi:hypothetical protein